MKDISTRTTMKNKMQVKVQIDLVSDISLKFELSLNFHFENEV